MSNSQLTKYYHADELAKGDCFREEGAHRFYEITSVEMVGGRIQLRLLDNDREVFTMIELDADELVEVRE